MRGASGRWGVKCSAARFRVGVVGGSSGDPIRLYCWSAMLATPVLAVRFDLRGSAN